MSKIKEMFKDWRYMKLCLYVVFTAALLYILYFTISNFDEILRFLTTVVGGLLSAFSPLMVGIVIAYLLSPLVDTVDNHVLSKLFQKMPSDPIKLEKRKGLRRTLSILITFAIILLVICVILYAFAVLIVGDLFFTSLQSMVESITSYFLKYESVILQWAQSLPETGLEEDLQDVLNAGISWLAKNINTGSIIALITNIGGSLLNLFLGIVISIYLLKDKDFFLRLCRKAMHLLLPMKANAVVTEALHDINTVVSQFVRGQLLDALLVAVMASIGFTLIGLDFAVLIGCFAGICNIIPYFGPIISAVPAAFVGFLTGGLTEGLLAILVVVIVQQIDSNITYPRIVGSSTGLHPLFILVAVTVGGFYAGILGMIIAVPVAAIIKVFIMKKIDALE